MNEMRVFINDEFGEVRTAIRDGEIWFVAADVCRVLEIVNGRHAVSRLDEDEKGVVLNYTSQGRSEGINCINEYGLYSLVLSSRKPQAKAFKRWVTHEVIPSIRKHGMYAASGILTDPETVAALITSLTHEQERSDRLQRQLNWARSPKAAAIRAETTEARRAEKARKTRLDEETARRAMERAEDDLPEQTVTMFLRAIREMIDSGEARVVEVQDGTKADAEDEALLGFEDDDYLYVVPQRTYDRVAQRYRARGEVFPVTRISLNRCLKALGLVTGDTESGVTTQVKRVGGKSMRLLWLKRSALDNKERR